MNQAELAAAKCNEPLPVDPKTREAFFDRQAKLIDWGTRTDETGRYIGVRPWPVHHWYTDEDFCRAYNMAVRLYDENASLRAALTKQAELMEQEARDACGDQRPDDREFFRLCAADCRDAAKEARRTTTAAREILASRVRAVCRKSRKGFENEYRTKRRTQ